MKELTVSEIAEKYNVAKRIALGWCQRGKFPNAHKEQAEFGIEFWKVPESDLVGFVPQRRTGRPRKENPSPAAQAKRRQREKK